MSLFKISEKDKKKEAWCETLFGKKARFPREFTEAQLRRLTNDLLMQHDRIIRESAEIVRNTKNEDTRLSRIELMRMNYYEGMLRLKPYCDSEQLAVINEAEGIVNNYFFL
jgi:hypothetical protein